MATGTSSAQHSDFFFFVHYAPVLKWVHLEPGAQYPDHFVQERISFGLCTKWVGFMCDAGPVVIFQSHKYMTDSPKEEFQCTQRCKTAPLWFGFGMAKESELQILYQCVILFSNLNSKETILYAWVGKNSVCMLVFRNRLPWAWITKNIK